MKATQRLHDLGQSLRLDNITRGLLTKGTLRHYITELPVTGLTSNPTIYDHANKNTEFYNEAIRQKVREGKSGEALFFELALEDLTQAADIFRPSGVEPTQRDAGALSEDVIYAGRRLLPASCPGRHPSVGSGTCEGGGTKDAGLRLPVNQLTQPHPGIKSKSPRGNNRR